MPNSCPIRRRTPVNQSQPQLTFRRTQGKPPWSQDPPDTSSKLVIRQTLLGRSTSQLRETGHGGGLVSVFVSVAFVRLRSPTLRSDPVMRAGREHARTTGKPGWKACWTDRNRDSNVAEKGPVGGEPVGYSSRRQRIVMDCGTGPARTYGSEGQYSSEVQQRPRRLTRSASSRCVRASVKKARSGDCAEFGTKC